MEMTLSSVVQRPEHNLIEDKFIHTSCLHMRIHRYKLHMQEPGDRAYIPQGQICISSEVQKWGVTSHMRSESQSMASLETIPPILQCTDLERRFPCEGRSPKPQQGPQSQVQDPHLGLRPRWACSPSWGSCMELIIIDLWPNLSAKSFLNFLDFHFSDSQIFKISLKKNPSKK